MKFAATIPKIPLNFLAILYIIGFQTITTNTRTSTLWKLNADHTKIIEADPSEKIPEDLTNPGLASQYIGPEDPLFNIITSTERYGSAWIKHTEDNFCEGCSENKVEGSTRKSKKNATDSSTKITDQKQHLDDDHELSCGKPVNFSFYDNLVGVMNRENHPPLVEPDIAIEFVKKYKFKVGKTLDLAVIENKLKQTKKEKPKSVGTLHQLGNFWRIKGDPRRAIECFRKALSVSPHNAEILLNLAKVLFHLQYLDDAIYLTRRSLEVAPPERGAWQQYFTLGEIFKAYGHYQEAQVHFRHTLDLHPGYEPAIKLLRELEEMPRSPWQTYTYIIIVTLVILVLVLLNTLDRNSENGLNRPQKHFNKSLKGLPWSGKKCKKISTNT